jgi:UDP-3-O-[3-hydroxymyristoyl] glucosamine N-acyltransferase
MTTLFDIITYAQSKFLIKAIVNHEETQVIAEPSQLIENNEEDFLLFWVNHKNIDKVASLNNGVLISPIELPEHFNFKGTTIVCEDPRLLFSLVVKRFFSRPVSFPSVIPNSSKINKGTIIEDGVIIGNRVTIGYNNVIHSGTIIEDDVIIGSNNTIGGIGFGYAKDSDGNYEYVPHIGGVLIESHVEIGNNTCIDRAVLGNTHIKRNCKIDNLVHIAHGVTIGENSLIIANAMVAGSVEIGSNTWIAPSTSIINGGKVGDNSMTGLGSVVISTIGNNELHVGVPAKKIKNI